MLGPLCLRGLEQKPLGRAETFGLLLQSSLRVQGTDMSEKLRIVVQKVERDPPVLYSCFWMLLAHGLEDNTVDSGRRSCRL